jgi:hypothetical protein
LRNSIRSAIIAAAILAIMIFVSGCAAIPIPNSIPIPNPLLFL